MRYGIIGGSFNPPHFGHLELAKSALSDMKFDEVLMLLTPQPPHKLGKKVPEYSHRLNMLNSLIEDEIHIKVCTIENERKGPHFTVDTIKLLKKKHPEIDEFWLIIGSDTLLSLHSWFKPDELLSEAKICTAVRPGFDFTVLEELQKITSAEIFADIKRNFLKMPPKDISSTKIRAAIKTGGFPSEMTKNSIIDYAIKHRLYV